MGQYFSWVNLDKEEYIGDEPWESDVKLPINTYIGNEKTDAALTLLASRWSGDRVVFMGDYAEFKNETDPFRKAFEEELGDTLIEDYLFDDLTDIAGLFEYVGSSPNCEYYDEELERMVPYTGPFNTSIDHYRYVIDKTLGEYVDRQAGEIMWISKDGEMTRYDPIPELMCSETEYYEESYVGRWFGHHIVPTNKDPKDIDKSLTQIFPEREYGITFDSADEEEIRHVIAKYGIDLTKGGFEIYNQIDSALKAERSHSD